MSRKNGKGGSPRNARGRPSKHNVDRRVGTGVRGRTEGRTERRPEGGGADRAAGGRRACPSPVDSAGRTGRGPMAVVSPSPAYRGALSGLPPLTQELPLPELLVPCGSEEALRAAVGSGADAVYLGGRMLNARMNAHNFDDAAMRHAVEYCHSRGVRVYVTLNTLVYDRELEEAARYAAFLQTCGVDALIVADMGLCRLLRETLPDMELHASTQMAVHETGAVRRLASLGFSRVVPARELSLGDICSMCRETDTEIEVFVHGALCVCRSGQCLFSSLVGGRSGNRGECAQPCRLPYNGGYPLSLRDLCLAGHLTELIRAGVHSLKIEGRMKSPAYIRTVTGVYRRLLDERRDATESELCLLRDAFSRGGFTDGYFTDCIDDGMLGVRSERDKEASARMQTRGEECRRSLPPIVPDFRRALPIEDAPSRRLIGAVRSVGGKATDGAGGICRRSARFAEPGQITESALEWFDSIALPLDRYLSADEALRARVNAVILPAAVHDSEKNAVRDALVRARALGCRECYIQGIGQPDLVGGLGFEIIGDFRLGVTNSAAPAFLADASDGAIGEIILSPELTLPRIRDIRADRSVIVYGRIPLMLLEHRTGVRALTDRRGVCFPVLPEQRFPGCREREVIYNSVPVYMADRAGQLEGAGVRSVHFIFSTETPRELDAVIEAYKNGAPPVRPDAVRRIK